MRRLIVFMLLVTSCGAFASERHSFMPDNDLWKEDNLALAGNEMTPELFNRIIDIGYNLYAPYAQQSGERLVINRDWYSSTVNASAGRDGRGHAEINMYGGMARRRELRPLSFALVFCHEASHLFGGSPYIDQRLFVSAEGQSDWMGAGWCLTNVIQRLGDNTPYYATSYMNQVCGSNQNCLKGLDAGNGLGALLAALGSEQPPRYEAPDPYVAPRTNLSYPSTQCRLDSYHNGLLGRSRPRCWYAGG